MTTTTPQTETAAKAPVLPDTQNRVNQHSPDDANKRIRHQTEESIKYLSPRGQDGITQRLKSLDQEWDVERVLETNASVLALTGLLLGVTVSRKFLLVPAIITGFLLQHALQGWCPPLPFIREMGFRTTREIDEERQALKVARGDFNDLKLKHRGSSNTAEKILIAVER